MLTRLMIAVIAALLFIGAGVGVGWFRYSPHYKVEQMCAAANAGDGDRLASYIDFPPLRSGLKEQLKAKMAIKMAEEGITLSQRWVWRSR